MRRLINILATAVLLLSGCDPAGPVEQEVRRQELIALPPTSWIEFTSRSEEQLTFAQYGPGTAPATLEASFWAVRGQNRTLRIPYNGQDPGYSPFFEFRVGPHSLLTYPNGLPFQRGDSVQITVTLDPRRFVYRFEPSGLTFSPVSPARLRVNHRGAHPDVNRDGVVDFVDAALELRFRIWQQQVPGQPWVPVPSIRLPGELIEGRVTHFTGFAMAS
jgi:hypothetical protein